MASMGTFGAFTAARMGLYASQAALNVTGNNIANINTVGYTRQKVDLVSFGSYSVDQYASPSNLSFGQGVKVDSIQQIRDQFLDIRFRDEQTKVGELNSWWDGLNELSSVLDEVNSGTDDFGIIEAQFNELIVSLQNLSEKSGSEEYDTLVRSAATTLTQLFNSYADKLETIEENFAEQINLETNTVNTLISNIQSLSEQIRVAGIYGDNALELRDARNLYIDQLSDYVGIDVVYSMESIDQYTEVQKLTIYIADTDIALVDGIYAREFQLDEYTNMINPDYDGSLSQNLQWLDFNGNPTNDEDAADIWRNPSYDSTDPTSMKYIASYDSVTDTYTYTNSIYGAGKEPNPAYDATSPSAGQWLDVDGNPTDDPDLAAQLNNNVDGGYDNAYLYTLSPLYTSSGDVLTDNYRRPMDTDIYLDDVVLSGALQGLREILTEEGEFSSEYDIAMDADAAIKRGIPYYKYCLDALALKFAETLNEANRITPDEIFQYNEYGQFMDSSQAALRDSNGDFIFDSNGNLTYPPLVAKDADGNDVYDANGDIVYVTIYNMYDAVPGSTSDPAKTYEDQIYAEGVRTLDYMINSDGQYVEARTDWDGNYIYDDDGKQVFDPIQAVDALGNGILDNESNPVYITTSNASDYYYQLEGVAYSEAVYSPLDMYETKEDPNGGPDYFVDSQGNPITVTHTDASGLNTTVTLTVENIYQTYGVNTAIGGLLNIDDQINYAQVLASQGVLTEEYEHFEGSGNLFSNSSNGNDATGITAANISISKDWSNGTVNIMLSKEAGATSTDNSNVLHIISLMDKGLDYAANDVVADAAGGSTAIFTGSFQEQFINTCSVLAQDKQSTEVLLENYTVSAMSLDNYRLSVSGVDLNDEATNMIQYQASYSAAARMITVLDEVLNTLIHMAM